MLAQKCARSLALLLIMGNDVSARYSRQLSFWHEYKYIRSQAGSVHKPGVLSQLVFAGSLVDATGIPGYGHRLTINTEQDGRQSKAQTMTLEGK